MQLASLLPRLKLEHLGAALDTLCEQAAKDDLGYREFLERALATEWLILPPFFRHREEKP